MNRWFTVTAVAAIVAALSPSASAQWPLRPQPGIPKGPDGKPNLTAPAPRTPDGKPDLTGVWDGSGGRFTHTAILEDHPGGFGIQAGKTLISCT